MNWFRRWWYRVPRWAQPVAFYMDVGVRTTRHFPGFATGGTCYDQVLVYGYNRERMVQALWDLAYGEYLRLRPGEVQRALTDVRIYENGRLWWQLMSVYGRA